MCTSSDDDAHDDDDDDDRLKILLEHFPRELRCSSFFQNFGNFPTRYTLASLPKMP